MNLRLFLLIYSYFAAGAFLWLADSAYFVFMHELSMAEALFSGISAGRLFLRLAILAVLIVLAWMHLQKVIHSREELAYWPQTPDDELWHGSPYSQVAGRRLLFFALKLAVALRMDKIQKDKLRRLCYCYDLGIFAAKPDQRFSHIDMGAAIAAQFTMLEDIVPLIRAHEEYYNGSGYYCLAGERIPLPCRILQVVLVFDNLCQGNYDLVPLSYNEALNELDYYSGTMLDGDLVALFQKLMRHTPMIAEGERSFAAQD